MVDSLWTCTNGHENHATRAECLVCAEPRPVLRPTPRPGVDGARRTANASRMRRWWNSGLIGGGAIIAAIVVVLLAMILNDGGDANDDELRSSTGERPSATSGDSADEDAALQRLARQFFAANYSTTSWYDSISLIEVFVPTIRVQTDSSGPAAGTPAGSSICVATNSFVADHPELRIVQVRNGANDDLC